MTWAVLPKFSSGPPGGGLRFQGAATHCRSFRVASASVARHEGRVGGGVGTPSGTQSDHARYSSLRFGGALQWDYHICSLGLSSNTIIGLTRRSEHSLAWDVEHPRRGVAGRERFGRDDLNMNPATRRKIGWILLSVALAAAVAAPIISGEPAVERTSSEKEISLGPVHFIVTAYMAWHVALQFSIPILLCGIAGLFCLLWPASRKSK